MKGPLQDVIKVIFIVAYALGVMAAFFYALTAGPTYQPKWREQEVRNVSSSEAESARECDECLHEKESESSTNRWVRLGDRV